MEFHTTGRIEKMRLPRKDIKHESRAWWFSSILMISGVLIRAIESQQKMTVFALGSKHPPAKPGALRLLAPQRGLIAIGKNQNREPFIVQSIAKVLGVVIPAKAGIQFFLDS